MTTMTLNFEYFRFSPVLDRLFFSFSHSHRIDRSVKQLLTSLMFGLT